MLNQVQVQKMIVFHPWNILIEETGGYCFKVKDASGNILIVIVDVLRMLFSLRMLQDSAMQVLKDAFGMRVLLQGASVTSICNAILIVLCEALFCVQQLLCEAIPALFFFSCEALCYVQQLLCEAIPALCCVLATSL